MYLFPISAPWYQVLFLCFWGHGFYFNTILGTLIYSPWICNSIQPINRICSKTLCFLQVLRSLLSNHGLRVLSNSLVLMQEPCFNTLAPSLYIQSVPYYLACRHLLMALLQLRITFLQEQKMSCHNKKNVLNTTYLHERFGIDDSD